MIPNAIISFKLFGQDVGVHMYGLMIAVGLLCCFGVLFAYAKKLHYNPDFIDFVFYTGVIAIIGGFVFAALFQAVYNYIENPEAGFHFGGITFLGGLIGGAATFLVIYFIFRKRYSMRLCEILTYIPCCILIAHSFGRIGCLCAGCCHGAYLGQEYVFGGIWMTASDTNVTGYHVPTQLYEAAFLMLAFLVLSYLVLKKNFKHGMSFYLVAYGIFRFIIEFFRTDARGEFVAGITPSQFWSLMMVVLAVFVYFGQEYFLKKRELEYKNEKYPFKQFLNERFKKSQKED